MPFADYLAQAVVEPLGLRGTLAGSPAHAYRGPLDDLLALGRELLAPTLVAPETIAEATTVQFPGLTGVLPGLGRMEPNDWGLDVRAARRASRRTGRARATRRARSATSAAAARSSGSIPTPGLACGVLTGPRVRRLGEGRPGPRSSDAVLADGSVATAKVEPNGP